jgi:hypothetical protein
MQDPVYELPGNRLSGSSENSSSRTFVNKGKKKGRIDWFEEGKFMRKGWYAKWQENGWLSHRKVPL